MALHARVRLTKLESPKVQDLDHNTLLRIYRTMYLSRDTKRSARFWGYFCVPAWTGFFLITAIAHFA